MLGIMTSCWRKKKRKRMGEKRYEADVVIVGVGLPAFPPPWNSSNTT